MLAVADPWAWSPCLPAWVIVLAFGVSVPLAHRRLARRSTRSQVWPQRQVASFAIFLLLLVLATTWPLAQLAANWSLSLLMVQRMLLVLPAAACLLLGLPASVIRRLTRPPLVDATLERLNRPVPAIIVVTVILVGSMTIPLIRWQSTSVGAREVIDLVVLGAGCVLWLPVVGRVPGLSRPKPMIRFVYLVGQAIIPVFLSFVFILARHPLYPVYRHSEAAIGLAPINDQQVAGFVSKLSMILVLLTVAGVVLARAPIDEEEFGEDDPLFWDDVEREFERADRRKRRPPRRTEQGPIP